MYKNIPQEEGIEIVCKAYETHTTHTIPREILGVILTENLLEFNGKNYRKVHGVAIGTKTALSFANIFMVEIEANFIQESNTKSRE